MGYIVVYITIKVCTPYVKHWDFINSLNRWKKSRKPLTLMLKGCNLRMGNNPIKDYLNIGGVDVNTLFRKRIGLSENDKITFETLETVLEHMAYQIPFENLSILKNHHKDLNKTNLINKVLVKNEGGLCYELNTILYYFLKENGFNVRLVRGVVFNHQLQRYNDFGRTHVTILIEHENQTYLVDTGFGGNLPLKPVPLTGEVVSSNNGEFRVVKEESTYGDYVLEIKIKHRDSDWRKGFTFDSTNYVEDVSELNEIQSIIIEHPESPFNKKPLVTKLTRNGNLILTDTSFTEWKDGNVMKEEIDQVTFNKLLKQHFGME